jgi:FHS family L-fucose permease-like MFS transporter
MPQLFAVLKQHAPFQLVFLSLMLPAYAYILFFAVRGYRVGLERVARPGVPDARAAGSLQ